MTVSEKVKYDLCIEENEKKCSNFGVRHVQALLMFCCLTTGYIIRVKMSYAIIPMNDINNPTLGVNIYDWNKQIQSIVLASFFLGYTLNQIPAGHLAHKYGVKPLIATAMIVNGLISLIFPWAVDIGGWKIACVCRILQGVAQSCFFPCVNAFVSVWVPHSERSRLSNFIYTGTCIGTILGLIISSLSNSTSAGWPCIFYTGGTIALVMGLLWLYFGANSPATHKTISDRERFYIQSELGQIETKKPSKTPWRSILTSVPLLAILMVHIGCNWGFLVFFTHIPSYMSSVLKIDVQNNGILTALPYTAMWIFSIIFSFISDFIVNNKFCSPTVSRKIFNTIGTWCPALGLIILSFLPLDHNILAIFLITITVGLASGMNVGYMLNHVDLSPNFAGILVGITNCIANLIGCLSPLTVGFIVVDHTDPKQWRTVFFIASAFYFVTNLFYIFFGTSKRQSWDEPNIFGDVEMCGPISQKHSLEKQQMLQKHETQKTENAKS